MFINEIAQGKTVKVSVNIKNDVSVFSSFVFYVFDGCILVGKITRNEIPIDFKNYKVDVSYTSPYDNETYIFKDCNIRLVKYKGKVYHHISTNMSSVQLNRRRSLRQYLGVEGVVKNSKGTMSAIIKDISIFGCAIISQNDYEHREIVHIMFKDGPFLFDEEARIIRMQREDNAGFLYGCEFLGVNKKIETYIKSKQKEIENF